MDRPNRIALSAILFVFLSVIAIGLVAATINSVAVTDAGLGNGGEFNPEEESQGEADRVAPDIEGSDGGEPGEDRQVIDLQVCIQQLSSPISILGIIAGMVAILYGIYRRYNMASSGLFATFLIPVVMFGYFFLTNCPGGGGGGAGSMVTGDEVLDGSQGGLGNAPSVPPSILALLFGGVIVVSVAALFSMTGEDETYELVEEDEPAEPDAADFARAAGRAADRIEETNMPVDNSVYRAWLEMTRLLDIENPDTAAPRDFAEEAIAVGLDEDDVYELTELFNEVRYGGKDPGNREERALDILRNIERTYQNEGDEA